MVVKYELFNKRSWIIALIFIVLVGLFVQYPYMNEFPSFIHAWSQSDRYAISLGFVNNDLDLFYPETFIYNKQFPHGWNYAFDNTITSVDFPILEYVVAVIMKITGNTSPWIFRTCTMLVALLGMFFLYKLAFLLTKDWIKSLLVTAVAMTSPVYAYYFNGFIPGIPALTFAIIALFFYIKYLNEENIRFFAVTIIFMTLSVLVRSSFAVFYVAILCFEILRILRKETKCFNKFIYVLLSFFVILAYYLWNKHLAAENGTLFLGKLLPANNWADFWDRMGDAINNWKYHYFAKIHYCLFAVTIVFSIIYVVYKKIKNKDDVKVERDNKKISLWIFLVITLFGYILFTIAMAKQFEYHDYYFIDTYFLPFLLLFILIIKGLPKNENCKYGIFSFVVTVFFIVIMLRDVDEIQGQRRKRYHGKNSERTISNYSGSDKFLDSVGVAKDAKILSLYSYPQNTPFILMNRKGFTKMNDKINNELSFDYDFVIIETEIYEQKKEENRDLFSALRYFADNGRLILFVENEDFCE